MAEEDSTTRSNVLYLFLGVLDKRAPPEAWDYLSIQELCNIRLVNKALRAQLQRVEYIYCRDGREYMVPYPGFPGVLATPVDRKIGSGLFQHQLASLEAMYQAERNNHNWGRTNDETEEEAPLVEHPPFGSLRGGILGDAPGLGKTITMLALIMSTAGARPVTPPEFWNDQHAIKEGWKMLRQNAACRATILTILKPVRQWVTKYVFKKSEAYQTYREFEAYASPPFPDERFPSLRDFQRYVFQQLSPFVPRATLELVRQNIQDLKASLDKRNRKALMNVTQRRIAWERKLIPSGSTLIIVPDALMEHWYHQIATHVNLKIFADEKEQGPTQDEVRGVVYLDGIGDLADARLPLASKLSLETPVEPAWNLNRYLIVVTTYSRCHREYANEVRMGRMEGRSRSAAVAQSGRKRSRGDLSIDAAASSSANRSSFLQMSWLRLVVDEGHELGTHEASTGVTRFVNELAAERRWVLSGTPTTGDEDTKDFSAKGLDQLQRLLFFLRHPVYGIDMPPTTDADQSGLSDTNSDSSSSSSTPNAGSASSAKELWVSQVKEPFLARQAHGRYKLLRVLKEIMIMHRKEDIELPKPIFKQAEVHLDISPTKQEEIRDAKNPAQTLSNYLSTEEFQTFVDAAQASHIVETIRAAQHALNNRKVHENDEATNAKMRKASGAVVDYSTIDSSLKEDKYDFRPVKAVVYSSVKNNLISVTEHLIRKLGGPEHVAEMHGGLSDVLNTELSRFRHGTREYRTCPVCCQKNDLLVSSQRVQVTHKCQTILCEVVDPNNLSRRYLIEPERIIRGNVAPSRLPGGEPLTMYGAYRSCWSPGDRLEVDMRDGGRHPVLPVRERSKIWRKKYGAAKCKMLARRDGFAGQDWYFGPLGGNDASEELELVKWQTCGAFHNPSRWYTGPTLSQSPIEMSDENVDVLCLDATVSHGLDLSFVTHMFLLEPIDNAALLEQVTSRAHRLGATGRVTVDTVNVLYRLSEETEEKIRKAKTQKKSSTRKPGFAAASQTALTTVVCQHCYRTFDSHALAEEHEEKNCPRNPSNLRTGDKFHLSSVYRNIRPPPPVSSIGMPPAPCQQLSETDAADWSE